MATIERRYSRGPGNHGDLQALPAVPSGTGTNADGADRQLGVHRFDLFTEKSRAEYIGLGVDNRAARVSPS